MDVPVTYRAMNLATATPTPSSITLLDNATAQFYMRYLMKRAIAAVKFTIPAEWAQNYFKYIMFGRGFGAVLNYPGLGVIFQGVTLAGRDLYYQPKRALLCNPVLENRSLRIGKDCAIIKLQPDYSGFNDIVATYSNRLALAYEAWNLNTQNSKLAYVAGFKDKASAKTFQQLFDDVQAGNPAVVSGKNLFDEQGKPLWTVFAQDLRQNYIAPDISADMRNILNEFDSFVGIPNNPDYGKKERSIVDEVNANNVETDTILDLAIKTLNEDFAIANEMFGLNLKAEKRYKLEGVADDN